MHFYDGYFANEVINMIERDEEKELPPSVGLTYNLKRNKTEADAEFDSIETINAIKKALIKSGCSVTLLEVNKSLPKKLLNKHFDIIFNIAEGVNGRSREAQIPALLDFFKLKFTGSDATTLCLCLDKSLAKTIIASGNIKTPASQVVESTDYKLNSKLKFPLIVKPNSEGSSKGISDMSVVKDAKQLKTIVRTLLENYGQPLLIEEYIKGREFTVGVLGNGSDTFVLNPMEIEFIEPKENQIYDYCVKQDFQDKINYVCPPDLGRIVTRNMIESARKIYEILGCKDFARIDFRLSPRNELYFIEINPLPGLTPGYSDMPMIAEKNGISYDELIAMIFTSAMKRYGTDKEITIGNAVMAV